MITPTFLLALNLVSFAIGIIIGYVVRALLENPRHRRHGNGVH